MSSTTTERSCFIGIHKAPPDLSREEFEAKAGAIVDAIVALPVVQKNLLKLEIISQNTLMGKHMEVLGLPEPAPTVLMSFEYESLDNLDAMLKDPALRKVFEESDDFGFRKHATAYAADVYTKVDVSDVTAGATVIGVFTSPPQFSEDQLRQKIKEVMDNITDQSIQNLFSHYSVVDPSLFLNSSLQSDVQNDYQWMQNDAVEKHLLALGFPAPKPLVVVRCETQHLNHVKEIFEHSEVSRLAKELIRDLGFHRDSDSVTESCCFSGDVATKLNNY
ncbi:hypothetical protein B0H14DRAFT_2607866 [Mycena olivaceomarginata]|nr:hypothetical protein B0H14DRAFT_2607866 [Mycena olivaceomarginata]